MSRDIYHHSPDSSLDSNVVQDGEPTFLHSYAMIHHEFSSQADTASLLKSFIKENLQGKHESTGGASSSDESPDLEMLRQSAGSELRFERNESVTPEPQPLTRSNVTLHDGIWRTDLDEDEPTSLDQNDKPLSLSPPLKGLRVPHGMEDGHKPWERVMMENCLSDAESDHSFSSQDTMILKTTEDAARGHLKYLEMYESAKASGSAKLLPIISKRPIGLVRPHEYSTSADGDINMPSTSGLQRRERDTVPLRRVRFASDVQFQENDLGPGLAQRTLNVDYSAMLSRGHGEHPDQDDGYESTDNASSTSSSSNGADPNALQPEGIQTTPTIPLKTDYGYVDRSKMPSFRKMNMELRKKAVTRSAENCAKNTVEDKLKALCIDTKQDDINVGVSQSPDRSPSGSDQNGPIEFQPRDASSPLLTDQTVGVSETNQENANALGGMPTDGSVYGNPDLSNENYSNQGSDYHIGYNTQWDGNYQGVYENQHDYDYTDGGADYRWANRTSTSIPDQPKRPAPILRDGKVTSMRGFNSTGSINAIYSERTVIPNENPPLDTYGISSQVQQPQQYNIPPSRPRPLSEMYSSQPELLRTNSDLSAENFEPVSNRFRSEPQLQRNEYGGPDNTNTNVTKEGFRASNENVIGDNCEVSSSVNAFVTLPRTNRSPVHMEGTYLQSNQQQRPSSLTASHNSYKHYYTPQRSQSPRIFSGDRAPSPARSTSPARSILSNQSHPDSAIDTDRTFPRQTSFARLEINGQNPSEFFSRQNSNQGIYNRQVSNQSSTDMYNRQSPPTTKQPKIPAGNNNEPGLQPCDIPGVLVYRSTTSQVNQNASDENLNTSGSTGSNDSGIEHSSIDGKTFPQPLYPSEARGHRAPVNYTLDDTSRDPMGLVEKVKRRRESSPVRRAITDTPPLPKHPEKSSSKSSLLCQPGEFTTPTGKDLNRMRSQQRVSPAGNKMQPMKALPMSNDSEWNDKLDGSAKKVLDTQSTKMKDEYNRYLQLYAKFQRDNNSKTPIPSEDVSNQDVPNLRQRSGSLDSQSSSSGYAENSSYGSKPEVHSENPVADTSFGDSLSQRASSPGTPNTEVKYMRTADIYKMMAEQRGPPKNRGNQLSTPTQPYQFHLGVNQINDAKTAHSSFDYPSGPISSGSRDQICSGGGAPIDSGAGDPLYSGYNSNRRSSSPTQIYGCAPGSVDGSFPQSLHGGSTRHASNADIYSLYTRSTQQHQRQTVADGATNYHRTSNISYDQPQGY